MFTMNLLVDLRIYKRVKLVTFTLCIYLYVAIFDDNYIFL